MGGRGRAHPSFGMTPTFREYNRWSQKTQILKKSVSYQKNDGRGHFWYDNDKYLEVCFLVTHIIYVHPENYLLQYQPTSHCKQLTWLLHLSENQFFFFFLNIVMCIIMFKCHCSKKLGCNSCKWGTFAGPATHSHWRSRNSNPIQDPHNVLCDNPICRQGCQKEPAAATLCRLLRVGAVGYLWEMLVEPITFNFWLPQVGGSTCEHRGSG